MISLTAIPGAQAHTEVEAEPPLLSIIIAAYNEERRLPRTLNQLALRWLRAGQRLPHHPPMHS